MFRKHPTLFSHKVAGSNNGVCFTHAFHQIGLLQYDAYEPSNVNLREPC